MLKIKKFNSDLISGSTHINILASQLRHVGLKRPSSQKKQCRMLTIDKMSDETGAEGADML